MLIKAVIQGKEEDEEELSLRLVIHPRPESVSQRQSLGLGHILRERLPEPAVEGGEIGRRITDADVAEIYHPGHL